MRGDAGGATGGGGKAAAPLNVVAGPKGSVFAYDGGIVQRPVCRTELSRASGPWLCGPCCFVRVTIEKMS